MLNDLIKLTDWISKLKRDNEDIKLSKCSKDNNLEPLLKENQKLTKDNNDLHLQMIQLKEDIDLREIKVKSQLKTIQGETKELKFTEE